VRAQNCLISTSDLKSEFTIVFFDPVFRRRNSGNSHTLKAEIGIFMFAWIFCTFCLKSNQIKSNQIYLPTQNMKEKKTDRKPEVKQNVKNNDKLEC